MKALLGCIALAAGACGQLIFTEYVEGSGYNKAVEVANVGSAPHDFSTHPYTVSVVRPQSSTNVPLTEGVLQPGEVVVVANSRANLGSIPARVVVSGSLNFNGDDAVALLQGNVVEDMIGTRVMGGFWLRDLGIRRASGGAQPQGFSSVPASWNIVANDVFDGLGCTGAGACVPPPPEPVMTALTIGQRVGCGLEAKVKSLVPEYEQNGFLSASYDQGSAVWALRAAEANQVVVVWDTVDAPDGVCAGVYTASVYFYSKRAGEDFRLIAVSLTYESEQEFTVTTSVSVPQELAPAPVLPSLPFTGALVANCVSATANKGQCSEWTLFGKLAAFYRAELLPWVRGGQLETGTASFEQVQQLLTRRGSTAAWTEEQLAVLEEYYTVNKADISLKFYHYEERAWDVEGTYVFVYNSKTRTVVVIDRLLQET